MKNVLAPIEFRNQRILLTDQLAEVYETDVQNIQHNYANNKDRFQEGIHYYDLRCEEPKSFKASLPNEIREALKFAPVLYLWTERGASRRCKILDTAKAWEQFDNLEATCFRAKEQTILRKMKEVASDCDPWRSCVSIFCSQISSEI